MSCRTDTDLYPFNLIVRWCLNLRPRQQLALLLNESPRNMEGFYREHSNECAHYAYAHTNRTWRNRQEWEHETHLITSPLTIFSSRDACLSPSRRTYVQLQNLSSFIVLLAMCRAGQCFAMKVLVDVTLLHYVSPTSPLTVTSVSACDWSRLGRCLTVPIICKLPYQCFSAQTFHGRRKEVLIDEYSIPLVAELRYKSQRWLQVWSAEKNLHGPEIEAYFFEHG